MVSGRGHVSFRHAIVLVLLVATPGEGSVSVSRIQLMLNHHGDQILLGADLVTIFTSTCYVHFFSDIAQGGLLAQLDIRDFDNWLALDQLTLGDVSGYDLANLTSNLGVDTVFELLVRRMNSLRFSCNGIGDSDCYHNLIQALEVSGSTFNYMRGEFVAEFVDRGMSNARMKRSSDDIDANLLDSDSTPGNSLTVPYKGRRVRLCTFTEPHVCACQVGSTVSTGCAGVPATHKRFWKIPVYHVTTDTFSLFFKSLVADVYIQGLAGPSCSPVSLASMGSECSSFHFRPRAVVPGAFTMAMETPHEDFRFLVLQGCPGSDVSIKLDDATYYGGLQEETRLKIFQYNPYSNIDIPCL